MSDNTTKPSTAFIDLATYDNYEKVMYGLDNAVTYFVRETVRSTWFTQIPIRLNMDGADSDFGKTFSANISRAGDYLLHAWMRVTVPGINASAVGTGSSVRTVNYTPNLMHNLVENCRFTANDMIVDELYSESLDMLSAFMVPQNKRSIYNKMIGNFSENQGPIRGLSGASGSLNATGKDHLLYLPLPFFFSRDSGLSLPVAALPYNKLKMEFRLRDWKDVICVHNASGVTTQPSINVDLTTTPKLKNIQIWGNYAIVSNQERKKMGCAPRDIIIEQHQQLGGQQGSANLDVTSKTTTTRVDLRLAHSIKSLFFCSRNMSTNNSPYRSNYSTNLGPRATINNTMFGDAGFLQYNVNGSSDPFRQVGLLYEDTIRNDLDASYYDLIQSYHHSINAPTRCIHPATATIISVSGADQYATELLGDPIENPDLIGLHTDLTKGYHMYSYALDTNNVDPNGSTNYGKLTNASLLFLPSQEAVDSFSTQYRIYISAINQNILRIEKGALGFPVL